jgi:hypothetical protein
LLGPPIRQQKCLDYLICAVCTAISKRQRERKGACTMKLAERETTGCESFDLDA